MYEQEFILALDCTRRLGFSTPLMMRTAHRFFPPPAGAEGVFAAILKESVGDCWKHMTPTDIAAQCLTISHAVLPATRRIFEYAYLTVGDIAVDGKKVYNLTEEKLRHWISHGRSPVPVDFHAWVTLASMEIIDFTLQTSRRANRLAQEGTVRSDPHEISIIAAHPDDLANDSLTFHPFMVGEAWLSSIGIRWDLGAQACQ